MLMVPELYYCLHYWFLDQSSEVRERDRRRTNDPPTSLSLSLPGVENEVSTATPTPMQLMPPSPVASPLPPPPPPPSVLQVPISDRHKTLNLNNANLMSSIPMAIYSAMVSKQPP
ncbi:hypothetical protein L1887_12671 [Cichorium endivia]|nr:hypothetical protein L1887_12671 [Cichorium endivia]